VNVLTQAKSISAIELDESNLRGVYAETFDVDSPEYFDPISRCYEEADGWSWSTAGSWQ
jgi:hypothetical protein